MRKIGKRASRVNDGWILIRSVAEGSGQQKGTGMAPSALFPLLEIWQLLSH